MKNEMGWTFGVSIVMEVGFFYGKSLFKWIFENLYLDFRLHMITCKLLKNNQTVLPGAVLSPRTAQGCHVGELQRWLVILGHRSIHRPPLQPSHSAPGVTHMAGIGGGSRQPSTSKLLGSVPPSNFTMESGYG